MALKRLWDPKSPHGMGAAIEAGDGLYWDGDSLAIGAGWGIIVTEDGVEVDKAALDDLYLEVSVGPTPPTGAGYKLWVNPDEVPQAESATLAAVAGLRAEMAAMHARITALSAR